MHKHVLPSSHVHRHCHLWEILQLAQPSSQQPGNAACNCAGVALGHSSRLKAF